MPLQLRGTVPVRGTANESVVEYSRCSNHERSKDSPRKPRPGWGFRSCALAFADYRAGPFGRLRKGNQARSSKRAERPNGPSVRTMTLWSQICKQSWSQKVASFARQAWRGKVAEALRSYYGARSFAGSYQITAASCKICSLQQVRCWGPRAFLFFLLLSFFFFFLFPFDGVRRVVSERFHPSSL